MSGKANPSKKRITISLTYLQAQALAANCDGTLGSMTPQEKDAQPYLVEALGQLEKALDRAFDRDDKAAEQAQALANFAHKLTTSQQDLPPEMAEALDKRFMELYEPL